MRNPTLILVALSCLALLGYSRTISIYPYPVEEPQCMPNFYLTPSGCWNSCAAPQYDDCPTVFTKIYNPSYCAYTDEGTYVSYTHECQACTASNVLAVKDGKCDCSFVKCQKGEVCSDGKCLPVKEEEPEDLCARIRCSKGYTCVKGSCVGLIKPGEPIKPVEPIKPIEPIEPVEPVEPVDPCALIRCANGYTCIKGKCVKSVKPIEPIDLCDRILCKKGQTCVKGSCIPVQITPIDPIKPVDPIKPLPLCPQPISCPQIRPSSITCPRHYYFIQPQEKFCGLDNQGKTYGFSQQCSACKNSRIVSYYQSSCEYLKQNNCIHQADQCRRNAECDRNEVCRNGACEDVCAGVKCNRGRECRGGKCVSPFENSCRFIRCGNGYSCEYGQCVPVTIQPVPLPYPIPGPTCATILCAPGHICRNGQCIPQQPIDNCAAVLCPVGTTCQNGKCITINILPVPEPIEPSPYPLPINPGLTCATILCVQGYVCRNGQCIKDDNNGGIFYPQPIEPVLYKEGNFN